jgi:hypothetical protein
VLKRTLSTVAVAVGLAAALLIPGVPATAASGSGSGACPPGATGSSTYCQKKCVVPDVIGDRFLVARVKITAADCKVGRVLVRSAVAGTPKFAAKNYPKFVVITQIPAAGTVKPAHAKVLLVVKFES